MPLTPTFTPAASDASNVDPAEWADTVNAVIAGDPAAARAAMNIPSINLRDAVYGAVGDGVADDTAALQAALNALEASTSIHRLVIPAGRYRINTRTANAETSTASYYMLAFGLSGEALAGRDIEIVGEPGAELYSTTSPTRANLLFVRAKMRSLRFSGIRFSKDDVLMSATTSEPNGSDAVSLVYHDTREIDKIEFENCHFFNCHGAFRVYNGVGNVPQGRIKLFRMNDCTVENPYGPNTSDAATPYGGGQQIVISSWVDTAIYTGNQFIGCASVVDPATNPLGRAKDGTHFGCPLHLVFTGNKVRNFGVEAVFQTMDTTLLGGFGGFTLPTVGASTTITRVYGNSTYTAGDRIFAADDTGSAEMEVVSYNSGTGVLTAKTVTNADATHSPGHVYDYCNIFSKDGEDSTANISSNSIRLETPNGGDIPGGAIYSSSLCTISDNDIYPSAIAIYPNWKRPGSRQAAGSVISGNILRGLSGTQPYLRSAIVTQQDETHIHGNTLEFGEGITKATGILIAANNCLVRNNVATINPAVAHGYASVNRCVAYAEDDAIGPLTGNVFDANKSIGWDVGVGPVSPSVTRDAVVLSHISSGDVLGIDPVIGAYPTETTVPFFDDNGVLRTMNSYDAHTDDGMVKDMLYSINTTFSSYSYYAVSATPAVSVGDKVLTLTTTAVVDSATARSLIFSNVGGSINFPRDFMMVVTIKGNITATGDWMHVGHFVQPDSATYSKTSPHYIAGANEGRFMVQMRKKSTAFLEARMVWMTTAGVYTEGSWVEIGASNFNESPKFLVIRISGGLNRTVNAYVFHGTASGAGKPNLTRLEDATFVGTAAGLNTSYPALLSCGFISPAGVAQIVTFANPLTKQ